MPNPILLTHTCVAIMTWERSVEHCDRLKAKDKEYGHELPYKQGDEVRDHTGKVGILIHKEFLHRDSPNGPGHDVWLLIVRYKSRVVTFTNPSAIKSYATERLQTELRPDAPEQQRDSRNGYTSGWNSAFAE